MDRKEKVSFEAMELINSLLQEKEHRLCSKKYRLNDYQHSRRTPGQLIARRADPHAQDYQGNYVYPDDATDIKSHSFFRRISWDRLHLTRPPFVPDVSGLDDTKYFDDRSPSATSMMRLVNLTCAMLWMSKHAELSSAQLV